VRVEPIGQDGAVVKISDPMVLRMLTVCGPEDNDFVDEYELRSWETKDGNVSWQLFSVRDQPGDTYYEAGEVLLASDHNAALQAALDYLNATAYH
jgi:hypothetical protein